MRTGVYYYEILGLKPDASLEDVKKTYRKLVKKNHPDLYPEEQKQLQELKMIQINEAFAMITGKFKLLLKNLKEKSGNTTNGKKINKPYKSDSECIFPKPAKNEVGFNRDVEYAYYKQGFNYFSKAVCGIRKIERNVQLRNDWYYMKRFASSLSHLRKADVYFSELLNNFPQSIWSYDAYIKKLRIEYFNRLYRKILLNIEKKLYYQDNEKFIIQ